jgi:hypothetical protein
MVYLHGKARGETERVGEAQRGRGRGLQPGQVVDVARGADLLPARQRGLGRQEAQLFDLRRLRRRPALRPRAQHKQRGRRSDGGSAQSRVSRHRLCVSDVQLMTRVHLDATPARSF